MASRGWKAKKKGRERREKMTRLHEIESWLTQMQNRAEHSNISHAAGIGEVVELRC
jgi:hypothetical protein